MNIEYIDRANGCNIVESVMGDRALRFAYETIAGRTLWGMLFGSKTVSALLGARFDSPKSRKKIAALAAIPGCRADEAEKPLDQYASFNEFFTRSLRAGSRPIGEGVVSPADGRLMLYLSTDADRPFPLKGAVKNLREVFDHAAPPGRYDIAVFRLAPVDYHRFHFPVAGVPEAPVRIPGPLASVSPYCLRHNLAWLWTNKRELTVLHTENMGDVLCLAVGATGVGAIYQTYEPGKAVEKGAEHGYFGFGGSTVMTFFEPGRVKLAEDILTNTAECRETFARMGDVLGMVNVES
jgi:phosphatidylserine decarboxylase